MNYPKLKSLLEAVLAGRNDFLFDHILSQIHCMSRPRVYGVINAIVSSMEAGELYVEVGTYQGGSLISALMGNEARAIGVDSFTEFTTTNNYEQTQNNLVKFGVANRVELVNARYQDFFANVPTDFVIQTYYYDGEHNYEGQLAGMEAGWPYLRPGSILIVDDLLYPPVTRAVNQFIANHVDNIKPLLIIDSLGDCDTIWWNGICVLRVI